MRYILDLYLSRINEIEIRDSALFTLFQFAKCKESSTYEICNSLKSTEYEADYKNVHKKIQRFSKCRFIEKTKTVVLPHKPVYYRLTNLGFIAILYHLHGRTAIFRSELNDMKNGILINHGNDDFLNLFVYPFFERETLIELTSDIITEFFVNYCTESAHKLMSKLYEGRLIDEHGKFTSKQKIKDIIDNIHYELESDKVRILENTMIFPIISQGKYKSSKIVGFEHSPAYKGNWAAIEEDVCLLVNDSNFFEKVVSTKNGFDNCYKGILECKS